MCEETGLRRSTLGAGFIPNHELAGILRRIANQRYACRTFCTDREEAALREAAERLDGFA